MQRTIQPTCEQRIDQHLKGRLAEIIPDISGFSRRACKTRLKADGRNPGSHGHEELRAELLDMLREQACEGLLSLEVIHTFKLCLVWGGPADYFELDWSSSSQCWSGGRYLFQDWFDCAQRPLSAEVAEQIAYVYGIEPLDSRLGSLEGV